jgi:signal transduction histidine kinase
MKKITQIRVYPYLVACFAIVLATVARMLLDPVVGEMHPFVTYIYAIIFSAWYCGLWPALLSLVLGFLCAAYFFAYPRGSIAVYGIDLQVGMTLYVFVGISSILFNESLRYAKRRAEENANALASKSAALQEEINKRQVTEQEKEGLLRKLVDLQEFERQRISRELHDQCGQDLVALQLNLEYLKSIFSKDDFGKDPRTQQVLADSSRILSGMGKEIHTLAFDLRPQCLDDLGLPTAIESLLEDWKNRSGLEVDFECRAWEHCEAYKDVSLVFYRVLQEAISNAVKHSRCQHLSVVLDIQQGMLVEIIEDDGHGIPATIGERSTKWPQPSLGILGMRERLRSVGGELEIESQSTGGTTLFARVPIPEKQRAKIG